MEAKVEPPTLIPDAYEKRYQCGGSTMCVYRGAKLYDVGGIYICENCLPGVRESLEAERRDGD